MGLHIPQKHIKHMSKVIGVVNLNTLTNVQIKNIKRYYEQGAVECNFSNDSITRTISKYLWDKYGADSHPHVRFDYPRRHTFKNYPAGHPVWGQVEEYLSLQNLLDKEKFNLDTAQRAEGFQALKELKSMPSDKVIDTLSIQTGLEYTDKYYEKMRDNYIQRVSADPANATMEARLKKIIKTCHTPVDPENEGMQIINRMLSREIKEFELLHVFRSF